MKESIQSAERMVLATKVVKKELYINIYYIYIYVCMYYVVTWREFSEMILSFLLVSQPSLDRILTICLNMSKDSESEI